MRLSELQGGGIEVTKIQLGRTREVTNSLKKWYNEEKKNADEDWWWGFNKKKILVQMMLFD